MTANLLHARNEVHTLTQDSLPGAVLHVSIQGMSQPKNTFKELIEAAAKPHPQLWKGTGELNLGALERFYKKKGHQVSQASFSRIFRNKQDIGPEVIEATYHALDIPRNLMRGEPMSVEMEQVLTNYNLSVVLMAQKLDRLPKADYYLICQQIERALENAEKVREAMKNSNVTPLHRPKQD